MSVKYNPARFVCAILAFLCAVAPALHAETLMAGEGTPHADVCTAIAAAATGDIIEVSGPAVTGGCSWSTPNLTIRGLGVRPVVTVEAGLGGWSIDAKDTVIENVAFRGSRCADGDCATVELQGGNLTLRNVSIRGGDIGVRAHSVEDGTLALERCEISANRSNISVAKIASFALLSSNVHNSQGGPTVRTAAVQNTIRNNRLAGGTHTNVYGELTIVGSSTTEVSGNVIVRTQVGSTGGLIQYMDDATGVGDIVATGNTLVNRAITGIDFVEAIGDRRPNLSLQRNIFWGDTPTHLLNITDAVLSNYFGTGNIFRSDSDFHLEGDYVPAGWGAATTERGFPFENVAGESGSRSAGKASVRSALGDPTPASVVLKSTLVSGSMNVFSNTVTLSAPAPAAGVTVALSSSDTSVVQVLSSSIVIKAGSTTGTFGFKTIVPAVLTPATITASVNGSTASASVQVGPVSLKRVTLERTPIGSNTTLTGNRVELTGPAPAGGMVVTLSSPSSAITVQSSVTIPAGVSSMSFTLTAGLVYTSTNAVITATHITGSQSAWLTLAPVGVSRVYLSPTSASGGQSVAVKVYLNGPAPTGGLAVNVSSSHSSVLPVPSTITVPAGLGEKGVVTTATHVSASTPLTVSASTADVVVTTPFTGIPTQISAVLPSATSVASGGSVPVTLRLTGPAPTGGITVYLSSSAPTVLSAPSTVFMAAGLREVPTTVKAAPVTVSTPVTITASAGGATTQSAAVTVRP